MNKALKWTLINGAYAGGIAAALLGVETIGTTMLVITWILLSVTPLFLLIILAPEEIFKEVMEQIKDSFEGRPVPFVVDLTYDALIFVCMIQLGWGITAAAWVVHTIITNAAIKRLEGHCE